WACVLRRRRPARLGAKNGPTHAPLSSRRHRRYAHPSAPCPRPRRNRLRRHADRNQEHWIRWLAHRGALSIHRRSRRGGPRSKGLSRGLLSRSGSIAIILQTISPFSPFPPVQKHV